MSGTCNPASKRSYKPAQSASDADIRLLIEQYPLAWICAGGGSEACLLPLIGVYDEADRLVELIGHYALTNPLQEAIKRDPLVSILFTGPQGYVSPSDADRRDWGPTWNYAQINIRAEISVEPELTARSLELLVDHVERDRPNTWSIHELGERYNLLVTQIVGFRASVTELSARFKLGQDEKMRDLRAILWNLPEGSLKEWMVRCNHDRLQATKSGDDEE